MIRVFAYDDSLERLNSLRALISLSDNLEYVGDAENCGKVLNEMEEYSPDVVLMDINMPIVDGLEGLKLIKSKFPQIKVLIQTAFDDSDKIFQSISNGASGYILKSDSPTRILQAIEEVYEGGASMNPAIAKRVLEYFEPKKLTVTTMIQSDIDQLDYDETMKAIKSIQSKKCKNCPYLAPHSR